jgi:hypothetical protein
MAAKRVGEQSHESAKRLASLTIDGLSIYPNYVKISNGQGTSTLYGDMIRPWQAVLSTFCGWAANYDSWHALHWGIYEETLGQLECTVVPPLLSQITSLRLNGMQNHLNILLPQFTCLRSLVLQHFTCIPVIPETVECLLLDRVALTAQDLAPIAHRLKSLGLMDCSLDSFDLAGFTQLERLCLQDNPLRTLSSLPPYLSHLDVSNTLLTRLPCVGSTLTHLNIAGVVAHLELPSTLEVLKLSVHLAIPCEVALLNLRKLVLIQSKIQQIIVMRYGQDGPMIGIGGLIPLAGSKRYTGDDLQLFMTPLRAMLEVRRVLIYFGIALDCDMPILEALFRVAFPSRINVCLQWRKGKHGRQLSTIVSIQLCTTHGSDGPDGSRDATWTRHATPSSSRATTAASQLATRVAVHDEL